MNIASSLCRPTPASSMATASHLMTQVLRTGAPNVCPTLGLNPGLNDKVRDHDVVTIKTDRQTDRQCRKIDIQRSLFIFLTLVLFTAARFIQLVDRVLTKMLLKATSLTQIIKTALNVCYFQ